MSTAAARPAALRLDRRVYLVGSAGLVRNIGRSATFVFLPLVFAEVYHLPYIDIGLLVAAIVPVSTLAFLAGGQLSDRFGRRPFAVYPSFVSAVAMLLLWQFLDRGLFIVLGLWAVNALLNGLTRPAQSAIIGDITPPNLRVTAYGVQRVLTNVGFAISPALGGVLAVYYGLPALFLFAAVTTLIEGTVLLFLLAESFPGTRATTSRALHSIAVPFRDRPFLALLLPLLGLSIVMNQFGTPLALFLGSFRGVSYGEFGLIYALNGALVVLLQLPISHYVERHRQYLGWMATGTLCYGISFLLFDAAQMLPAYLLSMAVLTVGEDIVSPTEQSLVAGFADDEKRGSYFGAYNAGTNATRVVGPVLGTFLLGLGASGGTFLWGGMFVLSVVVALGFYRLRSVSRGRVARGRDGGAAYLPSDLVLSGESRG